MQEKDADAFRTISEVAEELDLPQHVLRFWETRFTQIKPLKRGGGRRYYRPDDVDLVRAIRHLLYGEGYTIKGVQRILKEQGVRALVAMARGEPQAASHATEAVAPSKQAEAVLSFAVAAEAIAEATSQPTHAKVSARLSGEQVSQLRNALAELEECTRLLAATDAG